MVAPIDQSETHSSPFQIIGVASTAIVLCVVKEVINCQNRKVIAQNVIVDAVRAPEEPDVHNTARPDVHTLVIHNRTFRNRAIVVFVAWECSWSIEMFSEQRLFRRKPENRGHS